MDIRPIDLPELRADIVSNFIGPKAQALWADAIAKMGLPAEGALPIASAFHDAARLAELYHVSPDMCRLAQAAGRTLDRFIPSRQDAPSESGLMVFGGEIPLVVTFGDGSKTGVCGVLWGFHGGTFQFLPLIDAREFASPWFRGAALAVPHAWFTAPTEESNEAGWSERPSHVAGQVLPVMLSAWLLMQQNLARVTEAEPDRAARKRLRRMGQEPKPVRIIELRRPAHSGSGDGSREFHHQWIVKGHWRQQWYPAREVHRPVWIAPHIKGPEGAPLIGGEKVYALKR